MRRHFELPAVTPLASSGSQILLALAIAAATLLPHAALPALAQVPGGGRGLLLWPDGNSFTTFGPNAVVSIGVGVIDFIGFGVCGPLGGIDDQVQPAADAYIMPSGSVPGVGGALADVRGTVHTIVGTPVIDEVIGTTAPGGSLAPGKYAVVFNECQDGKRQAFDEVFDPAFEVADPAQHPTAAARQLQPAQGRRDAGATED